MNKYLIMGLSVNVLIWSFIGFMALVIIPDEQNKIPLLIYIAGKYSGDVQFNVLVAENAGIMVADKCNYPIVPHLLGYMSPENHTYEYWTSLDDIALEKSDAVWLISHSKGADAELALAKSLHKPIYYSIDEIPDRCK